METEHEHITQAQLILMEGDGWTCSQKGLHVAGGWLAVLTKARTRRIVLVLDQDEPDLLKACVRRAVRKAKEYGVRRDKLDFEMDLIVVKAAGDLDLRRLLAAPDLDFVHDVFGICRHLNRKTGRLVGHFSPRCAPIQGGAR